MLRLRQFATRCLFPLTQRSQHSIPKPITRSMTSGGQARLTGPVGPMSLALLVVGGGSAYWYVHKCRLETSSFIFQTRYFLQKEKEQLQVTCAICWVLKCLLTSNFQARAIPKAIFAALLILFFFTPFFQSGGAQHRCCCYRWTFHTHKS